MTDLTIKITTDKGYDDTVALMRAQLAEAGFGVLTEIDIKATLKTKLDVDVEPQIILGACRPQLAHAAMQADPSIAALLPCNVVVRADGNQTIVEAFDPMAMTAMALDAPAALHDIAQDARGRLTGALEAVRNA
ncbi:MAG: transporter [Aeromicrobium sp.]|nr:transporter [Aeromicrobium sp.]